MKRPELVDVSGPACAACGRTIHDPGPDQGACLDCIERGACGWCGSFKTCDCHTGDVDGIFDDGPQDTRDL